MANKYILTKKRQNWFRDQLIFKLGQRADWEIVFIELIVSWCQDVTFFNVNCVFRANQPTHLTHRRSHKWTQRGYGTIALVASREPEIKCGQ